MGEASNSLTCSMSSTTSAGEPRMLERRISNNRLDLTNDQQMNYLFAWFNHWSDLQREDFVVVLAETVACTASKHSHMNGLSDSMMDLNCGEKKRPPSLFSCQVALFRGWVASWSDDQKNYLIIRLKEIDAGFGRKYERFLEFGKDSPEKDYFEPGIPPELDLSTDKSSNRSESHNTSIEEEEDCLNLPDEDRSGREAAEAQEPHVEDDEEDFDVRKMPHHALSPIEEDQGLEG